MDRNARAALAFAMALIALTAIPAEAGSGEYFQPEQPDESMCQDMTGNWVMCESIGEDGIAAGGGAENRCYSSYGCPICGWAGTGGGAYAPACVTLKGQWGHCTCQALGTGRNKFGEVVPVCKTSGSCIVR